MFIKTALALALVLGTAAGAVAAPKKYSTNPAHRSEEHTSELQSRSDIVCRLLLEKKKQPRKKQATGDISVRSGNCSMHSIQSVVKAAPALAPNVRAAVHMQSHQRVPSEAAVNHLR